MNETESLQHQVGSRRRLNPLYFSAMIFALAATLAIVLPNSYRAQSTLRVIERDIPESYPSSDPDIVAARQLQEFTKATLTANQLADVMERLDIQRVNSAWARIVSPDPIESFQNKLAVELLDVEIVEPGSDRPQVEAITFSLAFTDYRPAVALQGAEELAELFLGENRIEDTALPSAGPRESDAEMFQKEAARLGQELGLLKLRLAENRSQDGGSLVEMYGQNLVMLQQAHSDLLELTIRKQELEKLKSDRSTGLAELSPTIAIEPAPDTKAAPGDRENLARLQREYRRRMVSFDGDQSAETRELAELQRTIEKLQKRVQLAGTQPAREKKIELVDNPEYVVLAEELREIDAELSLLPDRERQLLASKEHYESLVKKVPMAEQRQRILKLDYENTSLLHQLVREKQRAAVAAARLAEESKGAQFSLIEPAYLVDAPIGPNRPAIILLGLVLAVGCGLGLARLRPAAVAAKPGIPEDEAVERARPLLTTPQIDNREEESPGQQVAVLPRRTNYAEHFHLREKPFGLMPDSESIYLSQGHTAALMMLEIGLLESEGITLITGMAGTGKTTLIHHSLSEVGQSHINVATISIASGQHCNLLESTAHAFGVEYKAVDEPTLTGLLKDAILEQHSIGRRSVLIVDEAQNIPLHQIETLRHLTNLRAGRHSLLQIILVGQPELLRTFADPRASEIAQRISVESHLPAMSLKDTINYIRYRVAAVGGRDEFFESPAMMAVYYFSGGVPRLIDTLCDVGLLFTFALGKNVVSLQLLLAAVNTKRIGGIHLPGIQSDPERETVRKDIKMEYGVDLLELAGEPMKALA